MLPETLTTDIASFHPTVQAMLRDSAERWLAKKDRAEFNNRIVICIDPPRAFVLTHGFYEQVEGWCCEEGVLSGDELADFFARFGSSYAAWQTATLGPQRYPVRAFIKDGEDDWNWSIDTAAVA